MTLDLPKIGLLIDLIDHVIATDSLCEEEQALYEELVAARDAA